MKVLVTGAGGVLGREVLARLAADGHAVRAHDRVELPAELAALAGEIVVGDLRDGTRAADAVAGVDAVVHAAALPSPTSAPEAEVFTNNVEAAYRVLDAAGRAGVGRIVYVSSLSALGLAWASHPVQPLSVPLSEQHPYVGDDVYGLSKYVGEQIAATASRRWGATVVSLRFPFLGTGERLRHHLDHVHADPGRDRMALWGWLDSRDAARAVAAALTRPLTGYHLVNVAAPDTTAPLPTLHLMRTYLPETRVERALPGYSTPIDTRLAAELLDFTPIHTWRDPEGGAVD